MPEEIRVDRDAASILPVAADLSADGMIVEKLRSEVKRIVVERLKEEAEQSKLERTDRSKATFIIRMDESGSVVTEPVDDYPPAAGDVVHGPFDSETKLESLVYSDLDSAFEEDAKDRKAFITLLRMTLHLLLALKPQPDAAGPPLPRADQHVHIGVDDLADDIRSTILAAFRSHSADVAAGIAEHSVQEVVSSFRTLWPENVLPRRYFHEMEAVLKRLSRRSPPPRQPPLLSPPDAAADDDGGDDNNNITKDNLHAKGKSGRLFDFMQSLRGEFASRLRHFYSKIATDPPAASDDSTDFNIDPTAPDEL